LVSVFFSGAFVEEFAASEVVCAFYPPLVNPTLSGFLIGCPSGLFLRLN
jgi:RsiW-degrading membrane proteinase PrsW (M82 family)